MVESVQKDLILEKVFQVPENMTEALFWPLVYSEKNG